MLKIIRNFSLVLVPFALALACVSPSVLPNVSTLDPNAIDIAIEQTSAAAATQTARADPLFGVESPTPTLTRVPSMTPLPTFTPVVFVTLVRVTKNTNCRAGPGNVYPAVGVLRVGEVAEAVGRSANALYWIIRNPDRPGETCWLSGQYASLTGAAGALRVLTPPPTPKPTRTNTPKPKPTNTPKPTSQPTVSVSSTSVSATPAANFEASYHHLENCPGTGWWADLQLINNGQMMFRSSSMTVRDTVTNTSLSLNSDGFLDRNGCDQVIWEDLPFGSDRIVSSPIFSDDLTGHELQAAITLCSELGQSGTCITKTISFTP